MSRIEELKKQLDDARNEVIAFFADGKPKKTGDLIAGLGYCTIDFICSQSIGDGRGKWDDSPHQLALSDLIDEGEIEWREEENGDIVYINRFKKEEITS